MLTDYNEALDTLAEMNKGRDPDEISSLFDPVRFIKAMADIETGKDEPEPHQFKRDQHLTPAALFKARVIAMLEDEADVDSDALRTRESVIRTCISVIREAAL